MNTKYLRSTNLFVALGAIATHRLYRLYRVKGHPSSSAFFRRQNKGVTMKIHLKNLNEKPAGLSDAAGLNTEKVMHMLCDRSFMAQSSILAQHRFDNAWGTDPKVQTIVDLQRNDLQPFEDQKLA